MLPCRHLAVGLFALILGALPARGETASSPLQLVPRETDLLIQVENPRGTVQGLMGLDVLQGLYALPPVQEQLRSTRVHLFRQLVGYLEKELGASWPELVDRLAGGGIVFATSIDDDRPQPVLLVVQGREEKLMQRFGNLAISVLEQELARRQSSEKIERGSYQGIATVRLKNDLHLAVAGSALLVSNQEKALHAALDRHLGKQKKSLHDVAEVSQARRLLSGEPLAWLWLNMKAARKGEMARAVYKTPRDDPQLTILLGGYIDLLGRAPFLCAGLYQEKDSLLLRARLPRGRDGMGPDRELHVPPADRPGLRPVLRPRGVVYSDSGYLDVARIWQDRGKLFNAKTVQDIEKFDKSSGKFLSGLQMSKLLTQAAPYYRIVVANQKDTGYKKTPQQTQPAFAVAWEMRQPDEFYRSMRVVLQGAALLASTQVKLKRIEEKYHGCEIIGWRFSETDPLPQDVNDVRFSFSPCFFRVKDQFVASSTLELGRELVDLLQKEERSRLEGPGQSAELHLFAPGIADLLGATEDQLLAATILDQAADPTEAKKQVKDLLALVRQAGDLTLAAHYAEKDFHYDIRWRWADKAVPGVKKPAAPAKNR